MKRIFALLMAAVMAMSLLAGCGQKEEGNNTSSGDNTAGDSQYHIGFVVHTTSGDVMAAIEYGAKAAAEDYGVKLTYTGPADSDNTQQISMFESLVAAGCDAIVIIAGDSTVWDEPIAAAVEKGVTVVITDSDAPTSQRAAYFGVNTAKLAYDLGTAVRAQTGDEGTVALGVCVLEDESAELTRGGQSIRLIGLTDIGFHPGTLEEKKDALRTALSALLPEDEFSVTLAHRPELMDVYTECGAPLVLSGHAHGGQIRLPGIGGLIAPGQGLFPKYTEGKYEENGTTLVVSRGIGNSVLPLRVNDRPQIVVVQLACNYRM